MLTQYTQYYTFTPPGLAVWLVSLLIYFLPSIIAKRRRHRNRMAIYALNFFLGMTGIGWALSLVWSLTHNTEGWRG